MPLDQIHEQENKIVKESGGAIGLTENPTGFWRWMLSGAELFRVVSEFEGQYLNCNGLDSTEHHEQGLLHTKMHNTVANFGNQFITPG